MNASASYRLGEVGGFKDDPRVEVPPLEYRNDLRPGEQARLLVEYPDEAAPAWTEIRKVLGPGWYLGRAHDGSEVEFGSEHVFAIRGPRYQMGAWYDHLPGAKPPEKRNVPPQKQQTPPPQQASPQWFDYLRGGKHYKKPSLFEFWKKGAPADPAGPAEKRGSFWDIFRRKPRVEVGPIPAAERREARPSFLQLPFQRPAPPASTELQVFQEPPPGPTPPEAQEAAQAAAQAIIMPEAPRGGIASWEGTSRPPDDLFQVLVPEEGLPGAPGAPLPPPPAPGSIIVSRETQNLPSQVVAFSILELGPSPEPFGTLSTIESATPFTMIQPEEPGTPTPFDVLVPSAELPGQGLVVRPSTEVSGTSVFDILEPQVQPLTPFQEPPPSAAPPPTVFDPIAPPPEPPKKKKSGRRKPAVPSGYIEVGDPPRKLPVWQIPTREEWVKWVRDTFNLEGLWGYLRKERLSDFFIQEQIGEGYGGDEPTIPVETWEDAWDFDSIFNFFGIPGEITEPYTDWFQELASEGDDEYEAWEAILENLIYPLSNALYEAFKVIKPSDLPGDFVLGADDGSNTWGLLYYEKMDPKEAARLRREMKRQQEIEQREAIEADKHRKAALKKIWGATPRPEDLVPWIEQKYDIEAMFRDIKKQIRSKVWREQMKEYGEALISIETVADIGPNRSKEYQLEITDYFGIPPDVIALYEDAPSDNLIWNEIFFPFFESVGEAFTMLLPYADLPGRIVVEEDEDDKLAILYFDRESED